MKALSINKQLQIALIFVLMVFGIGGGITYSFIQDSQDDNALINALGRQRMLTQAMGKSVFGYASSKSDVNSVANSVEGLNTYITQMRTVYTSSIIKKIKGLGDGADLGISMNPHQEDQSSVPFPATFARLVNERFKNQDMERKVLIDILAEDPVNPKQGLQSDIDRKANVFLNSNPKSIYFDHEQRDNKLHLLFYAADTATVKVCVSCHTKIKNQSFNIGDVLGIRKYDIEYGSIALAEQVLNPSLSEYESSLNIFEESLKAVMNGGEIKGIQGGTIAAVDSTSFQSKATEIVEKLSAFKKVVDILVANSANGEAIRQARQNLLTMSNELRKSSNELVGIYSVIAEQHKNASNLVLIFGAMLIAAIMAAIVFALNISVAKPLKQMSGTLESLASGNLAVSFDSAQKNQEMTELSQNLNKVTDSFNGAIQKMLSLSGSIIDSTGTSQQKVDELVQMSAQLSDQSSSVATSAEELTATTHEIAKNAEGAANSAREANTAGDNGRQVVQHTMDNINNLAGKVENASATIKTLEQDSNNIGGILDVISDIAEQTNLLALNAAIEAARAGDQGRGFSVVADEVRNLAQRTQDATKEIQTMITKLQQGAQQAVTVMDQGQAQAEKTVEDANKVNEALVTITDEVAIISDMNNQIASAAEQQAATTQELASSASASHDNSTRVENTLKTDIASALGNLSSVADELKETSDRFRL